jgi:hypothetical protein
MDEDPKDHEARGLSDQQPMPSCEQCGTNRRVVCIDRTETMIYFSCAACAKVWGIEKSAND